MHFLKIYVLSEIPLLTTKKIIINKIKIMKERVKKKAGKKKKKQKRIKNWEKNKKIKRVRKRRKHDREEDGVK